MRRTAEASPRISRRGTATVAPAKEEEVVRRAHVADVEHIRKDASRLGNDHERQSGNLPVEIGDDVLGLLMVICRRGDVVEDRLGKVFTRSDVSTVSEGAAGRHESIKHEHGEEDGSLDLVVPVQIESENESRGTMLPHRVGGAPERLVASRKTGPSSLGRPARLATKRP